jgi:hypothetical protein
VLAFSFVVQLTVAEDAVIFDTDTLLIVGAVVSGDGPDDELATVTKSLALPPVPEQVSV